MKKIISLLLIAMSAIVYNSCTKSANVSSNSTGGSTNRFAVYQHYLYTVDVNNLKVFDISDSENPLLLSTTKLNYGLETIFVYENYLYIGANDGIYVFELSKPEQPLSKPKIQHQTSCDPVVVQGDFAYSTQRMNGPCGRGTSVLQVYDVSDKSNPVEVNTTFLSEPYGLAVDGSYLFVCDDQSGVLVFSITNPADPITINTIPVSSPRDIIIDNTTMIVSTVHSYELYNIADIHNIKKIATYAI